MSQQERQELKTYSGRRLWSSIDATAAYLIENSINGLVRFKSQSAILHSLYLIEARHLISRTFLTGVKSKAKYCCSPSSFLLLETDLIESSSKLCLTFSPAFLYLLMLN